MVVLLSLEAKLQPPNIQILMRRGILDGQRFVAEVVTP